MCPFRPGQGTVGHKESLRWRCPQAPAVRKMGAGN